MTATTHNEVHVGVVVVVVMVVIVVVTLIVVSSSLSVAEGRVVRGSRRDVLQPQSLVVVVSRCGLINRRSLPLSAEVLVFLFAGRQKNLKIPSTFNSHVKDAVVLEVCCPLECWPGLLACANGQGLSLFRRP